MSRWTGRGPIHNEPRYESRYSERLPEPTCHVEDCDGEQSALCEDCIAVWCELCAHEFGSYDADGCFHCDDENHTKEPTS